MYSIRIRSSGSQLVSYTCITYSIKRYSSPRILLAGSAESVYISNTQKCIYHPRMRQSHLSVHNAVTFESFNL